MVKIISRLKRLRTEVEALLDESFFRREGEASRFYKFLHFWVLVGRSFIRNRCPIRASALSYTTLLALIPILAVAMSVTTSVLKKEGQAQIEQFIGKFVASMVPPAVIETNETPVITMTNSPVNASALAITNNFASPTNFLTETNGTGANVSTNAVVLTKAEADARLVSAQKKVAEQIYGFIQNTQSSAITGIGSVLLIIVAIRMIRSIEATFNDIWGVTRGRGWGLSIAIYWATMTLGPVLLVSAIGLASGPHFEATRQLIFKMPFVGGFLFKLLPLVVMWLTFMLLYKTVPNTKVNFNAALVGALVSGTILHLNNVFGFLYVSRVVSSSKIYGSLALVPVFMAGIYFSWLILLFGAQVAYAFQNRSLYFQERLAENVNQRGREFVALRLATCIGQRFQGGLPLPTIQEMSDELGIPSRLIQQVLQTLTAAGLITEVSGAEPAYTPSRPLEKITAHHILMAMRATQGQELMTRDEPVREEVYGEFARIQEAERQAASAVTMLALVNRATARLELAAPEPAEKDVELTPAMHPASKEIATEEKPIAEMPENPSKKIPPNSPVKLAEPDKSK
jgi:membrane protein